MIVGGDAISASAISARRQTGSGAHSLADAVALSGAFTDRPAVRDVMALVGAFSVYPALQDTLTLAGSFAGGVVGSDAFAGTLALSGGFTLAGAYGLAADVVLLSGRCRSDSGDLGGGHYRR